MTNHIVFSASAACTPSPWAVFAGNREMDPISRTPAATEVESLVREGASADAFARSERVNLLPFLKNIVWDQTEGS